jgi:hypothetical protein
MVKKQKKKVSSRKEGVSQRSLIALVALLACSLGLIHPMSASATQAVIQVTIEVEPYAEINFPEATETTNPLLSLSIPPPTSTIPSMGTPFTVKGNASASVVATPDAWLFVGGENQYFGKAVMGAEELGYNLIVEFPTLLGWNALTGNDGEGTAPFPVNVSSGPVQGMVHLLANHTWTADGTWPLPGTYTAVVTVVVTGSV